MRYKRGYLAIDQEERRREVGPLFAYMDAHCISAGRVLRQVSDRYGRPRHSRQWLSGVRSGHCLVPWWLVRDFCKVFGLPMAEVMGPAWVAEFGEKYGLVPPPLPSPSPSPSEQVHVQVQVSSESRSASPSCAPAPAPAA